MIARVCFISFFLLAVVVPFAPVRAQQPAPIGTIIEVEGTGTLSRSGQPASKATINTPVYQNDLLETGSAAKMDILFVDDSEFTLGENTRLKIDEYIYDANASTGNKSTYSVLNGVFLFVSGLMTDHANPNVAIETPYGSIGMRGTTVWGGPLDGEFGVLVQDGAVDVKTDQGAVRVNAGLGTHIKARKFAPSAVKAWPAEKVSRAQHTIALKRHEMVRQRVQQMKARHQEMRTHRKELFDHRKNEKKTERMENLERRQKEKEAARENLRERRSAPFNQPQRQKIRN